MNSPILVSNVFGILSEPVSASLAVGFAPVEQFVLGVEASNQPETAATSRRIPQGWMVYFMENPMKKWLIFWIFHEKFTIHKIIILLIFFGFSMK
jgi:hypothetical protein